MNKIVALLICCLVLTGCAKDQIIDRIKLIQAIGYDLQGDALMVSGIYSTYEKKSKMQLLSGEIQSFNEILTPFAFKADSPLAIGQLRTIAISEALARKGISKLAGTIVRDPHISNRAALVITKDRASEILAATLNNPPVYLSHLIKHNMENGFTPFSNGHIFLNDYFGDGQDVYLPILVKDHDDVLKIDGVGVFQDEKLKLLMPNLNGLFIKLLKDDINDIQAGNYHFKNDLNELISFRIVNSKHKATVNNETALIRLKLEINLGEYPAKLNIFENKVDMLSIKSQIEKNISAETKDMLEYFQKERVDPIGIGALNRVHQKNWNEQSFRSRIYPKLRFDVRTQVKILSLGVGN